jgi:hypothetical protein
MTRNGKIARLPDNVRDELNTRLDLGEDGPALLDWLNAEPEVQECLKNLFEGVPVSKQNLSEWRLGGYREWQLREEWIDHAYELDRNVFELGQRVEAPLLAGQLAAMLAARYAALINTWDGEPDPVFEQKLRLLRGLNRDIALLQRTLLQAGRHERENLEALEADHEKVNQRHKDRMSAPVLAKMEREAMAITMGGDENAWKMATVLTDAKYDLRQGQPMVPAKFAKKPETEVNKDQNNGSHNGEAKKAEPTPSTPATPAAPKSEPVKPSQTESNHLNGSAPDSEEVRSYNRLAGIRQIMEAAPARS